MSTNLPAGGVGERHLEVLIDPTGPEHARVDGFDACGGAHDGHLVRSGVQQPVQLGSEASHHTVWFARRPVAPIAAATDAPHERLELIN
jgi:hypothetical protein